LSICSWPCSPRTPARQRPPRLRRAPGRLLDKTPPRAFLSQQPTQIEHQGESLLRFLSNPARNRAGGRSSSTCNSP
jgi:hypothetical protein